MTIKIPVAIIFLIMIISTMVAAVSVKNNFENTDLKIKEISVALVVQNLLITSGHEAFVTILDSYSWVVGNTKYVISLDQITDRNIFKGELTIDNYDLMIMPGGGGGGHSIWTKSQLYKPLVKKWRKELINFIKDGGGYYGVCGGTYFILGLDRPPQTVSEHLFDKSSLGVSCVDLSFISYANPIFCQFAGYGPEAVGQIAYMFYSGWDLEFVRIYPSGLSFDCPINRNHPFSDDYLEDSAHIRWVGGPGYSINDNPGRDVTVLAHFPEEEISENKSMRIHVWKYTGGLRGLVKGTLRHLREDKSILNNFSNCLFMAEDWEMTDEIMKTNYSNKPYMTAEVYPNKNKARIFICSGHPEMRVWWGGNIMEVEDHDHNNLYDGLHGWDNQIPQEETPDDEYTHNWWMVRRGVAWAAKVPDNDLPPVYGYSQISDFYPYEQPTRFRIIGNSASVDVEPNWLIHYDSLDMYYRYSDDNCSWSNWILYNTDIDSSDGWSWDFNVNSANGTGYYQFNSIRKVQYTHHLEIEKAPPGPDAVVRVVNE